MCHMSFYSAVKIPLAELPAPLRFYPKDPGFAGSLRLVPQRQVALHPVSWHWSLAEGEERGSGGRGIVVYLICWEYSTL